MAPVRDSEADFCTWTPSTFYSGYYGSNYLLHPKQTLPPSALVVTANGPYATWTYHIHPAGGTSRVTVNQQQNGGQWNTLGTYVMTPGQNHRVVLANKLEGLSWVMPCDLCRRTRVHPASSSPY